jgi:ATP-dependent DNA helicase RecG
MAYRKDTHLKQIQKLSLPLSRLKGIGPKRAALLARKGIHTVLDLLFFTPIRYEDRRRITSLCHAEEGGEPVLVRGRVLDGREDRFFPSRKRVYRIHLQDGNEILDLLWFQYRKPHLMRLAKRGMDLLAYGRITVNRGRRQIIHPDVTILDPQDAQSARRGTGFYPVYSLVKGVSANLLRSMMDTAVERYLPDLIDPLPGDLARDLGLPVLADAIRFVHHPARNSSLDALNHLETPYQQRLLFDRFFLVMLVIAFRKRTRKNRRGPALVPPASIMDDLDTYFPFKLTTFQIRAIEDTVNDLAGPKPMNRLLLGDVGCGKTVVAAVAATITVRNGRQAALMVPTQILAAQHLDFFSTLPKTMGFRPVLLTGALSRSERESAYAGIKEGTYNLVIGTHALVRDELSFSRLGLVIIDEQHRFGVRERVLMDRKGDNSHQLVMTATPIPRTLAMTIYGDLDISVIEGYPEGHRPVATHLVTEGDKRRVFETAKKRMSAGQQVFVICPVIEGSEEGDLKNAMEMAEKLKKVYGPEFRVGLVHGRLSPDEREGVMNDFRKGRTHLLVGTTVIEVGLDIPAATVMVIEHPERFGLAQLHQLRGRVGRGSQEGICFLMASRNLPESALSRVRVLVESHDGFEIAEKDLEQRGQGQLIGLRQAGMGELDLGEIMRNEELLASAREAARHLIEADPGLVRPENAPLKAFVESVLSGPLDL